MIIIFTTNNKGNANLTTMIFLCAFELIFYAFFRTFKKFKSCLFMNVSLVILILTHDAILIFRFNIDIHTCNSNIRACFTKMDSFDSFFQGTLSLFSPCSHESQCPTHASCLERRPDGRICYCNIGYIASDDSLSCIGGE